MAVEGPRRRKLAELVSHHFLGHHHRNVLVAVVDPEDQADELRQDRRAAAPRLDHVMPARCPRGIRLFEQIPVDERTFPHRTRHVALDLLLLPRVAAGNDEFGGLLVGPGLLALGGLAPRGDRMAAARAAAFAAAERVIDRVHGDAAIVRHAPEPALAPGLADRDVHVIGIGHRADGRHAAAMDQALLAGIEAYDHVFLVAADDLGIGPGRARDLAALADLHLHIVDDGADRHVARRHGIAGLDVHVLAGDDGVALTEPLRRQDVGQFAVLVLDEGDEAGAVRIIFDPLDAGRLVVPSALEVDEAQRPLVAAAAETHGDAAVVIAAAA